MLSYRHGFHAGNFADVFKHVVLTLLIDALKRKETPFCYLDTHAGAGRYDLGSAHAQKNREHTEGIGRLWKVRDAPPEIRDYLAIVRAFNGEESSGKRVPLRYYPGSPRLVRALLRPQDRMVLTELHPTDFETLKEEFAGDRQVAVHHLDGYQGLKSFLPPKERRGLVLIDPAFEDSEEFKQLAGHLQTAVHRWTTGIYAIWYPLVADYPLARFHRAIKNSGIPKVLLIELSVYPEDNPVGLNGSGVLIVNPPWLIDEQLEGLLPRLWKSLSVNGQGGYRMEWLREE
jgi:23S rRNA (adenine2030-N6)-methyltransferase